VLPWRCPRRRSPRRRPEHPGDQLHRVDRRRPQGGRDRGPPSEARAPRARRATSALIVLDDADLDLAASAGAWGSFLHQGQICMTNRPTPSCTKASWRTNLARLGREGRPPAGRRSREGTGRARPPHRRHQRDKVHSLVTASIDAGARLVAGGHVRRPVLPSDGARRRDADHPGLRGRGLRPGGTGHRLR